MRKTWVLLLTLLLAGCGGDAITGTFILEAADGFVRQDNTETPHTYIIESDAKQVYVGKNHESFTEEEMEAILEMDSEERAEFLDSQPVVEDPVHDITLLETTDDAIVLEYGAERIVFTALSDSYYKTEDGTQYVIEHDSSSIQEYLDSLMDY